MVETIQNRLVPKLRIIAVSYMLPPMLFPQAIQIGRLLEGCGQSLELLTVTGRIERALLESDFGANVSTHIELDNRRVLNGLCHKLAMKFLPFYGRAPDEYSDWVGRAIESVSGLIDRKRSSIDAIVTFGEPMSDHLVGLQLKKRFGLPWVAHFSDPWADNPFRRPYFFSNIINKFLERRVCKAADSLIFTSEETRQLVMQKYPASWVKKAFVLPHSYVVNEMALPSVKNGNDGKIVFRYLGNFYGHRTPFPLINSLRRLLKTNQDVLENVKFEIVGEIAGWMKFHPAINKLPSNVLEFIPQVSYNESIALMKESDVLLVIDAPAKNSVFLPSKLIDYIGSGRQILGIVPQGTSSKLILRMGGCVADPSNPPAVDAAVLEAIRNARSRKNSASAWGDADVRAEFDISRIAPQFLHVLQTTIAAVSVR